MNDEDFHAFRSNPDIDLVSPNDIMLFCIPLASCNFLFLVWLLEQSLLGDRSHRLLSAAQAAKMAVVYSQYTSLYVLTNVVSCSLTGTCRGSQIPAMDMNQHPTSTPHWMTSNHLMFPWSQWVSCELQSEFRSFSLNCLQVNWQHYRTSSVSQVKICTFLELLCKTKFSTPLDSWSRLGH